MVQMIRSELVDPPLLLLLFVLPKRMELQGFIKIVIKMENVVAEMEPIVVLLAQKSQDSETWIHTMSIIVMLGLFST